MQSRPDCIPPKSSTADWKQFQSSATIDQGSSLSSQEKFRVSLCMTKTRGARKGDAVAGDCNGPCGAEKSLERYGVITCDQESRLGELGGGSKPNCSCDGLVEDAISCSLQISKLETPIAFLTSCSPDCPVMGQSVPRH